MARGGPKRFLKTALRRAGLELRRYEADSTYAKRRQRLLESCGIDTVLDIGAHAGEYGQSLRHEGFAERIVSFEPLTEQYRRLRDVAEQDGRWSCKQVAIGDRAGQVEIHISGNDGFSSSVRPMASSHEAADPASSYVGSATVMMETLDEAAGELGLDGDDLMLKVDVQGYESEVLAGAEATLRRCQVVELELGFVELYEGQSLLGELVAEMRDRGLLLNDLEPGFRDPHTGELLQVDGLFVRTPAIERSASDGE
jgi:FkbM family methyltransferase